MTDFILVDGDKALFEPNLGQATAVPRPGTLKGSGPAFLGGKKACVEGDEASVSVAGCLYQTPQYSIPGTGTLEIAALGSDHVAKMSSTGGKKLLLVGGSFTSRLKVTSPAFQPPPGAGPPIPDSTPEYSGSGSFLSTHQTFRGT